MEIKFIKEALNLKLISNSKLLFFFCKLERAGKDCKFQWQSGIFLKF